MAKTFTASDLFVSLAEANEFVNENKIKGCICPCCGQFYKVYNRKFNAGMAYALLTLYKLQGNSDEFMHIGNEFTQRKINYGNTEFCKLKYWGFAEQLSKKDSESTDLEIKKGRTTGYWRITELGRLFAQNKTKCFQYMIVCNQKLIGTVGDQIGIRDALKDKFDYEELMAMDIETIIRKTDTTR